MPFLANLHGKIYITWSPLLHLSWYDHPSHVCVTHIINIHSLCQLHPPKVSYHVSNFMQHCSLSHSFVFHLQTSSWQYLCQFQPGLLFPASFWNLACNYKWIPLLNFFWHIHFDKGQRFLSLLCGSNTVLVSSCTPFLLIPPALVVSSCQLSNTFFIRIIFRVQELAFQTLQSPLGRNRCHTEWSIVDSH